MFGDMREEVEKNTTVSIFVYTDSKLEHEVLRKKIKIGTLITAEKIQQETLSHIKEFKPGYSVDGWKCTEINDKTVYAQQLEDGENSDDLTLFENGTVSFIRVMVTDLHFYANEFVANSDTPFTVVPMFENPEDDDFMENSEARTVLYGKTDTSTAITIDMFPEVEGFYKVDEIENQNINGDGSTEVKIYYKRKIVKVTYNYLKSDGTYEPRPLEGKYGSQLILEYRLPNGWVFEGWNVVTASGTGFVEEILSFPLEDTELTPRYKLIEYTITYVLNGGTNDSSNPESYTMFDAVQLNEPAKTGFIFEGWFDAETGGNQITGWIPNTYLKDFVLYARWRFDTLTPGFGLNFPVTSSKPIEITSVDPVSPGFIVVATIPISPNGDYESLVWLLDGEIIGNDVTVSFNMADYTEGCHELSVIAVDVAGTLWYGTKDVELIK